MAEITLTGRQLANVRHALLLAIGVLQDKEYRANQNNKPGDAMIYRRKQDELRALERELSGQPAEPRSR